MMEKEKEYILRSQVMDTVYPDIDVYNYLVNSEGFSNDEKLALVSKRIM